MFHVRFAILVNSITLIHYSLTSYDNLTILDHIARTTSRRIFKWYIAIPDRLVMVIKYFKTLIHKTIKVNCFYYTLTAIVICPYSVCFSKRFRCTWTIITITYCQLINCVSNVSVFMSNAYILSCPSRLLFLHVRTNRSYHKGIFVIHRYIILHTFLFLINMSKIK
jgi:hypothetical protein